MWKLFQSVIKSFRTQHVIPCNRISTLPQDSASVGGKSDEEDGAPTSELCGGGHSVVPTGNLQPTAQPPKQELCNCSTVTAAFPQISLPSAFPSISLSSRERPTTLQPQQVYSIKLPISFTTTTKKSSKNTEEISSSSSTRRSSKNVHENFGKRTSMAAVHNAMGLAALKSSNKDLALQHFLIAADVFNSSKANYNLGVLYQFHLDNAEEATRRYRLAGNHPDALFNLAYLTLHSPDAIALLPNDVRQEEAITLLTKAASFGSKEAARFLSRFECSPVAETSREDDGVAEIMQTSPLLSNVASSSTALMTAA